MRFCISDWTVQGGSRAAWPRRDKQAESTAGTEDSVRQNTQSRSGHDT